MTTLPPTKDVLELLRPTVLPALAGAALVVCLSRPLGRWAGALGSAAAVAAAFLWVNYNFDQPGWTDGRLLPWKPVTPTPDAPTPGYHWLPRAALLLLVVGLLTRWVGLLATHYLPEKRRWAANLLVWAPRAVAVVAVSGWLSGGRAAEAVTWLYPALAAVMFVSWVALDGLARSDASVEVTAYLGAALVAAGGLLLYAHSAPFMELGVGVGFALLGVALAAGVAHTDAGGAIPAGVVFLPGLALAGRTSLVENKVPEVSFWLAILAPLVLLPFLIPGLNRQNRWAVGLTRAGLILIPLAIALRLAMLYEKLPHEIETEW